MLSLEEAVHFVTEVLGIESPIERKQTDPHGFLNELILRYHETIPFQSLSLIAVNPLSRRRPTFDETKQAVTTTRGGLCYSLNTFMKFLLEALGYEVYFVCSSIVESDNHIVTIVCNLIAHGDRYLVDVGSGYPTFEAIPLDFESESPVYKHSFIVYKFVREGERQINRWHHSKTESMPVNPEDQVGKWKRVIKIDLTPRDIDSFDAPMDVVYTDPSRTSFHKSLRATVFSNQKAVCIKDMSLLLEDDSHRLLEIKFADQKALLQAVQKYFPLLYSTAVSALLNYTQP